MGVEKGAHASQQGDRHTFLGERAIKVGAHAGRRRAKSDALPREIAELPQPRATGKREADLPGHEVNTGKPSSVRVRWWNVPVEPGKEYRSIGKALESAASVELHQPYERLVLREKALHE